MPDSPHTGPVSRRVAFIVPCHDEVHTIARVVHDLRHGVPGAQVLVVDNGSTDGTAEAAREAGARVIRVPELGKGNAVRVALTRVDADVVGLIDGDATYEASEATEVIGPVLRGEADMAVGERRTYATRGAFGPLRHVGNVAMTGLINLLVHTSSRDALSGYRALSRELLERMSLRAEGFEIEVEILCEARRLGARLVDVPIHYSKRHVSSASKLVPFWDAMLILRTAWRGRPRRRALSGTADRNP